MEFLGLQDSSYFMNSVGIAVVVTIIVVAISIRYSFRYLFNIQTNDNDSIRNEKDISHKSKDETTNLVCDGEGDDGDDEFELDENEDATDTEARLNLANKGSFFSKLSEPRYTDPMEYCEHIQGEIKRVQQTVATKTIEKSLSDQQLQDEKLLQRQQLAQIFKVMEDQHEKFGLQSMDEVKEQMKLYSM